MLSIFGYCSISLSMQSRIDKLVDLLSIGKVLLSCQKPTENIIVAFLFPCFLLGDLTLPAQNAVKGMLLYILALRPDIVRRYMEDKYENWEKLIL
ncbi:hypothetical protein OSTOST_23315 [Ostertagia ostertagi]